MAKQEFTLGADDKFTPEAVRLNGVAGNIWTYHRLSQSGWMHMGKQFISNHGTRRDVVEAFDQTYRPEQVNK